MSDRPDFLFIMTDQQRADWLGCYGHPILKTPNIDNLANVGTRFSDFHVASPVCMPNRASFMTGRYPSVHGLRYNGCVLPERANTFVDVLKAGGYRTASIGKSHLQPFTDIAPHSWGEEAGPIVDAWKLDAGDYGKEEPDRYDGAGRYDFPTPYYGFDHIDMVTNHGDQAGGHYRNWFRETHPNWQELTKRENELPHNYSCPQAFRTPVPEESYSTAYIKNRSIEYLQTNANSNEPMFTFVSFPDPHHPFNPPGSYWDMYNPDQFDVALRYEDHKNPPPFLLAVRQAFEANGGQLTPQTTFMASDQHIREAMALTAGMITMVDDAVGEIMQALKASGRYENTIVIFNSDHGDYLGDFNLLLKGAWPKESITRVPMIWSDPANRLPAKSPALTSTIDLPVSIITRAGLQPYFGMQGKSFVKNLDGKQATRNSLLIEFNDVLARTGFDRPARVRTLVTQRWHLSVYKDQDWGELYDRKNDPFHTINLWNDSDHALIRGELMIDLAKQLIDQMDESPRAQRLA